MSDAEVDELDALLLGFEPLPDDLLAPTASVTLSTTHRAASCPLSTSSARETAESVTSQAPAKNPAPDGGRRARYRARSRNELLYLREVVAELEHELKRLKRRVSLASCRGCRLTLPVSTQSKVWKALACRQKLERQDAEAENARLRVLLENQLRFAAQLQCLLGPHAGVAGVSRSLPSVRIDAADVSIFEAYILELDDAYARTNAVLRETGLDVESETPGRVINMRHPTGGATNHPSYAEFLDTYVMLSDMETARGNIWEVVMQEYMKRNGAIYEPETPQPGALALKFRYPYKWYGRDGFVSVTHTLKTYNEQDRQVTIYRVLSVGEGALGGIATDETGWSVLQPSSADASRSVCRVVTRLTPMRFHRLAPQNPDEAPPQLLEFAKVLFQVGDEDFGKMLDRLQRLSIGEAPPAP